MKNRSQIMSDPIIQSSDLDVMYEVDRIMQKLTHRLPRDGESVYGLVLLRINQLEGNFSVFSERFVNRFFNVYRKAFPEIDQLIVEWQIEYQLNQIIDRKEHGSTN